MASHPSDHLRGGAMTDASAGPESLNDLLVGAGIEKLKDSDLEKFDAYLELLLKWNLRINLTAIRERGEILRRHFVECIACAGIVPPGIGTVLDFGSGAGFPGIPIAICRPDLHVTLAESQKKKAAFLSEAMRAVGVNATVFAGRAESIGRTFDCVTLRAVDRMSAALKEAFPLVSNGGSLIVMTTEDLIPAIVSVREVSVNWERPLEIPGSYRGKFLIGCPQ